MTKKLQANEKYKFKIHFNLILLMTSHFFNNYSFLSQEEWSSQENEYFNLLRLEHLFQIVFVNMYEVDWFFKFAWYILTNIKILEVNRFKSWNIKVSSGLGLTKSSICYRNSQIWRKNINMEIYWNVYPKLMGKEIDCPAYNLRPIKLAYLYRNWV